MFDVFYMFDAFYAFVFIYFRKVRMLIKPEPNREDLLKKYFPDGMGLIGEVPEKITTLMNVKYVSFPLEKRNYLPFYLGILSGLLVLAILMKLEII